MILFSALLDSSDRPNTKRMTSFQEGKEEQIFDFLDIDAIFSGFQIFNKITVQ